MAVPFATQQIIRIVTEKVMENIIRQQSRSMPVLAEPSAEAGASGVVVDPNALNQLVRYVQHLEGELKTLQEKHAKLDSKMKRLEERWGWKAMFRVVLIVVVAFILGAFIAYAAHLGGWY